MKSIIINPFTPIPKSDKSHVRGWAMVWAQRLNADIANKDTSLEGYDNIYIEHGVNFSGSLNLFGGFNDEVFNRVQNLITAANKGANLFSLDWNIDDCKYVDQVEKRVGAKTTSDDVDFDFLDNLDNLLSSVKNIDMQHPGLALDSLILGDSHSVAYSKPNQAIKRINGQLLYSAMKTTIYDFIIEYNGDNYKDITLCLGSIDIRFHALFNILQPNKDGPDDFAKFYAKQVIEAQDKLGIPISVCAPVPVEYEDRKLPKTGQYGGVNFKGSRQERLDYTLAFIDKLDDYCCDFDLVIPPKEWYQMDGEQYAKQIMESTSSVHIAPTNYNSILGW